MADFKFNFSFSKILSSANNASDLALLYFIGETEAMDYRTSVKNREKYLFVEDADFDGLDDDSVEEPPETLVDIEALSEPLMPGQ